MCKADRVENENMQRVFTGNLLGPSLNLRYRIRCGLLGLEAIWPRLVKFSLELLYDLQYIFIYLMANVAP